MNIKPHDALFKAAFEHPVHAAGLFRHLLPPLLVSKIDWATLKLEPGSFVDDDLHRRHSDLLFSVRIGEQELLLYVLLEHQSSNVRVMPLRSLGYIVRIWERRHREADGPLPLIIALVVSHAPEGWTSPVRMHEIVMPPPSSIEGVAELVPGFTLLVEDLAHLTNEQLKSRALEAFPKLVLWALRDARNAQRLLNNLVHWVVEFGEALRTPSGIEAVSRVFHYIALVCDDLHYDQFRAKIREQLPEAERTAMTIAEELIQKGRAEGRAQGQAEGRAQGQAEGQANLLVKMLTRKFGDVPTEYRTCIAAATCEQLERYAERFVAVDTLAAIFADD